ncbi:hypothetical protein [Motilibacter aurantiacus]|uniref:hypothetical protein n=1 Tax=Motilibacter aurantiacus TaxID=2714955 RepID=UPI001407835D|nr:hypothetical protein [Motilibacter aurantiacus]NHC47151.1 hypothetical protein [Motilibacter aurantiacus]
MSEPTDEQLRGLAERLHGEPLTGLGLEGPAVRKVARRRRTRRVTAAAGAALAALAAVAVAPTLTGADRVTPGPAAVATPAASAAGCADPEGRHARWAQVPELPQALALQTADFRDPWREDSVTSDVSVRSPEGRSPERAIGVGFMSDADPTWQVFSSVLQYRAGQSTEAYQRILEEELCLRDRQRTTVVSTSTTGGVEVQVLRRDIANVSGAPDVAIVAVIRAGDRIARVSASTIEPASGPLTGDVNAWGQQLANAAAARLTAQQPREIGPAPRVVAAPPDGFLQAGDIGPGWRVGAQNGDRRAVPAGVMGRAPSSDCDRTLTFTGSGGTAQTYRKNGAIIERRRSARLVNLPIAEQVVRFDKEQARAYLTALTTTWIRCNGGTVEAVSGVSDEAYVLVKEGVATVVARSGDRLVQLNAVPVGADPARLLQLAAERAL